MNKNNLHAGHRDRMRKRFAEDGFDNYRPHEVLEQVLFFSIRRSNTNETAHLLLERFGSVEGVLDASVDELVQIPGIGLKAAEYLASLKPKFEQAVLQQYRDRNDPDEFGLALLADLRLRPENAESLYLVVLDELSNIMKTELIPVVRTDDKTPDLTKTAEHIAEAAGSLTCRIVLSDADLLTPESAEELYRIVNRMGCRMEQILLTENGDLYLLVP